MNRFAAMTSLTYRFTRATFWPSSRGETRPGSRWCRLPSGRSSRPRTSSDGVPGRKCQWRTADHCVAPLSPNVAQEDREIRGKTFPVAQRRGGHHRLLSGGNPTSGPFAATTDLGFARFFFPLLEPVFGMGSNPAIRQQGLQGDSNLTRSHAAREHASEICRPRTPNSRSRWPASR